MAVFGAGAAGELPVKTKIDLKVNLLIKKVRLNLENFAQAFHSSLTAFKISLVN